MNARSGLGVYSISVAAELSGVGQQTLRLYERRGLLTPARTSGGTRRYSDDDLARLRRIVELAGVGVNVAGIGEILGLEARNVRLESDNHRLKSDNNRLRSDNDQLKSDYALLVAQRAKRAGAARERGTERGHDDRR
ncbi:MerR family transcriptional regulator [Mycolicibacter senuensis]|uniref:MerR family transcriptional regulator n=1 Tax=Mycolicibacter senuensis TaxID=386913 RepID=UPI000DCE2716|nr:MerR family transcriptional regulator [Mycolicibacter senuensis]RAU99429.1 MerR family transcriptional regulator [Mycolicibacter senuensis]